MFAGCATPATTTEHLSGGSTVVLPTTQDPKVNLGRTYTDAMYAGDYDALFDKFSKEMRTAIPLETLKSQMTALMAQLGPEAEVLSEEATPYENATLYVRMVRFQNSGASFRVHFAFGDDGSIQGCSITKSP